MASRTDRRRANGRARALRALSVGCLAGAGPTPQPIGRPAAKRTPATSAPVPTTTRSSCSSTHGAPTQETPTQEPPAGCAPSGPVVGMGSRPARKAFAVTGPDGIAVTEYAGQPSRALSLPVSDAWCTGGGRPTAPAGTAALRKPAALAQVRATGP